MGDFKCHRIDEDICNTSCLSKTVVSLLEQCWKNCESYSQGDDKLFRTQQKNCKHKFTAVAAA